MPSITSPAIARSSTSAEHGPALMHNDFGGPLGGPSSFRPTTRPAARPASPRTRPRRIRRCSRRPPAWGRGGRRSPRPSRARSEEHTSELQSRGHLVCRLLLEKKKKHLNPYHCSTKKTKNY